MLLEDYRKEQKLSYDELSALLDIPKGRLFTICKQRHRVSLYDAQRITNITGGVVSYEDLLQEA